MVIGHLPKKVLGRWIAVEFYDHFINSHEDEKSVHRIDGYVESLDDEMVTLHWWRCLDDGTVVENHEPAKLLQGSFIRWAFVEPKRWNKVR